MRVIATNDIGKIVGCTGNGAVHQAKILDVRAQNEINAGAHFVHPGIRTLDNMRSEEHTSELQSLMRISYAVFCLKKKTKKLKSYMEHTKDTRKEKSKKQQQSEDQHTKT